MPGSVSAVATLAVTDGGTSVQEIEALHSIFQILGTPTEDMWPGVSALPDYMELFPKWPSRPLSEVVPTLDTVGLDILQQMLQ